MRKSTAVICVICIIAVILSVFAVKKLSSAGENEIPAGETSAESSSSVSTPSEESTEKSSNKENKKTDSLYPYDDIAGISTCIQKDGRGVMLIDSYETYGMSQFSPLLVTTADSGRNWKIKKKINLICGTVRTAVADGNIIILSSSDTADMSIGIFDFETGDVIKQSEPVSGVKDFCTDDNSLCSYVLDANGHTVTVGYRYKTEGEDLTAEPSAEYEDYLYAAEYDCNFNEIRCFYDSRK